MIDFVMLFALVLASMAAGFLLRKPPKLSKDEVKKCVEGGFNSGYNAGMQHALQLSSAGLLSFFEKAGIAKYNSETKRLEFVDPVAQQVYDEADAKYMQIESTNKKIFSDEQVKEFNKNVL